MHITLRAWPFEVKPEEADENGEAGGYEYHYAGWNYELVVDGRIYVLGRRSDEPERVDFYGTTATPTPEGCDEPAGDYEGISGGVPYKDAVFVKAARWLLKQPGIERLTVFTSDPEFPDNHFVSVDPQRFR